MEPVIGGSVTRFKLFKFGLCLLKALLYEDSTKMPLAPLLELKKIKKQKECIEKKPKTIM